VEIVVTGRRVQVPDRFRRHVEEKLTKVEQIEPRVQRIDVVLSQEGARGQSKSCERVEITLRRKGPAIRAEACSDDRYGALDQAAEKLAERLRRIRDKRKVHRGRRQPASVAEATADLPTGPLFPESEAAREEQHAEEPEQSPIEVREKVHAAAPMTLDQALYEMELVGHDFFLFHDSDTDQPSVVYRRRGWRYGVIHLKLEDPADVPFETPSSTSTTTAGADGAGRRAG
jgi:ribosomal subunit interface protein